MRLAGTRSAAVAAAAPAALALLAWLVALQHAVGPARVVAGLLLVFVLPGVAGNLALFPDTGTGAGAGADSARPSRLERVVLVPALSLAVPVIGGVLLDVVGLHLTAGTWGGLGALTTVVLAGVGYLRGRHGLGAPAGQRPGDLSAAATQVITAQATRIPPGTTQAVRTQAIKTQAVSAQASTTQAVTTQAVRPPEGRWSRRTALRLAPLGLAVVVLAGAAYIGLHSANLQRREAFTALSMLPDDDPNSTDQVRPVTLSVDCHEVEQTRYTVQVQEGDADGPRYQVSLAPGEVWKQDLNVPISDRVTANLFKGDGTTPYRTVFVSGLLPQ
ncbi:hypothetical protein GCM10023322_15570 [Rugosimonospora acidiphila]|uniref:DUF1616 domain-containing protein n=1 Tax=Rugosimonospora acidiphila TaxID=556531 RepID=A0ABP9RN68_9ACTN